MEISGYRGFRSPGTINFAIPNGRRGSGLTLITGPNNSGKSSILESLRARTGYNNVSFTTGTRNSATDYVSIKYIIDGHEGFVRSITKGSSETERELGGANFKVFVLPSRRAFNPYFGRGEMDRDTYLANSSLPAQRASTLGFFEQRLFRTLKNPTHFNELLRRVLGSETTWSIDQSDQGQYFLKFFNGNNSHSSDGMGEGIISIFAIIDALHDSNAGEMVVIDEPELSLHPSLQKRLASLLYDASADRQIVIATHSPYFVDLKALSEGGQVVRVTTGDAGTLIHELSEETKGAVRRLSEGNIFNPHVFGLDARELFFQDDRIILTEGQEDVLLYPKIADSLGVEINGNFFGWGVGGAGNMKHFCSILKDLGFEKVAGILDGDKASVKDELAIAFPSYHFACIPAKDIRTKPAKKPVDEVVGILDEKRRIRPEHEDEMRRILSEISAALAA